MKFAILKSLMILALLCFMQKLFSQYADFQISPDDPCAPVNVTFSNLSDESGLEGSAEYHWEIDGTPFNQFEPVAQIWEAGEHFVSLTLIDGANGSVQGYKEEFIFIEGIMDHFRTSTGPEACPGEQILFWTEQSFFNLYWHFGDGSFEDERNYNNYTSHTFYESGEYSVNLLIDNMCGTDTITRVINVSNAAVPEPEAYTHRGGEVCPNEQVLFGVAGEYMDYEWDFGDGKTSAEAEPAHFYETQTTQSYDVIVKVTNICGNQGDDTLTINIVEDLPAYAMFDYGHASNFGTPCPGERIRFNSHSAGAHFWDFGDGSTSEERNPVNVFTAPGDYDVGLTVTNGCGFSDIHTETIVVEEHPEDVIDHVDFSFDVEIPGIDHEDLEWLDTVTICPGQAIRFWNHSWDDGPFENHWDFGDGKTSNSQNPIHVYSSSGFMDVTLTAYTPCGGMNSRTKVVHVDPGLPPNAEMGVAPRLICPGEEVFFFDMIGDPVESQYTYSIDFGDGTTGENIVDYTNKDLMTLASHHYNGGAGDKFFTVFTATNKCGNSITREDTIEIIDNPDIKTFYYVNNTSVDESEKEPADWSVRQDPTDHHMTIFVQWPDWTPGLNENFFIYFWYGQFDPEGEDPGQPDGIVSFTSANINTGTSVDAYIPIDPVQPLSVGMASGWFCSGVAEIGIEPEVYGMPLDGSMQPVKSIPITSGGVSDLAAYASNGIIIDPAQEWDGICNADKPRGRWVFEENPENYIHLDLYSDGGYDIAVTRDEQGEDYIMDISWGSYHVSADTLFLNDSSACMLTGIYKFVRSDSLLDLSVEMDPCFERETAITGKTFRRRPDYGVAPDLSVCPGDLVQFKVAGGTSYEWHFGDGDISAEQYPTHAYATAGDYDAYVVATNACNRVDTIHTLVKIRDDHLPNAWFYTDMYSAPRLQPIQFITEEFEGRPDNNTYSWDFGDGTNSTEKNPTHSFKQDGEYMVTLTMTNSCGSSVAQQTVFIKDQELECESKFEFDVVENTVNFADLSLGKITSWFWDFGDGYTSSLQSPSHNYNTEGVYHVCLSVMDEEINCMHQICREVIVGSMDCKADFTYTRNDATLTIQVQDLSSNADEWFWDFGDGYFADMQDPVHTYSEAGRYPVALMIYDAGNDCYSERVKEIVIGIEQDKGCAASFEYFVEEASKKVVFTDKSSGNITNWYWTFGDGTFIEQRHPDHTYMNNGIYPVCLNVFDENSGCFAEVCKEVIVGAGTCNLNAEFSFFVNIEQQEVAFSNKSKGDITEYFWHFGDGTTSIRKNPVHQYEEPGFYLVSLSVFNEANECNDHFAKFIQVGTVNCRAAFNANVDATTRTAKFKNLSTGDLAEYFWDFGDGSFSSLKEPTHVYEEAGMYPVALTVVSSTGLCMDHKVKPIQVGEILCSADFSYFVDSATSVAYFEARAIGNVTDYLWFFGDGTISEHPAPKHKFPHPGFYNVGLNTFDLDNDCMDFHEEVILIGSKSITCQADFIYSGSTGSNEVKFTDRSIGGIIEYLWDFGDGSNINTSRNPTHIYPRPGYYNVCLTVVNNQDIPDTYCKWVRASEQAGTECLAGFMFSVDSVNQSVTFRDNSRGKPDQWYWDFGDGSSSTVQNPKHGYSSPGFYDVLLSITNSNTNCTSKSFRLVNVSEASGNLKASFFYETYEYSTKAEGYPVNIIGTSIGDANKFNFNMDDGTQDSTNMIFTHIYDIPGVYNVCLTVEDPVTQEKDTDCKLVSTTDIGIIEHDNNRMGLYNYPNPFRSETTISYYLTEAMKTKLHIYDMHGRLVSTLVDHYREKGIHRISFNRKGLANGVYYVRLIAGEDARTRKMIIE